MAESFPRVLLVTDSAFGEHSATAITLTNLFRGWPADRIAVAHHDSAAINPGYGICCRLWQISSADVPIDRTVRALLGNRKNQILGSVADGMPAGLGARGTGESRPLRGALHGFASAWADLLPMRPPPAFWNWVNEFQPHVIYSPMGSIRWIELVTRVAAHCRAPIVPHFLDDWPATFYAGWLKALPRWVMLSRLRSLLRRASFGMTISAAMAGEYEQRFGIHCEPFMNCVDVPAVCPMEQAPRSSRPVRFLYVGGLHLNRWRALVDVGEALSVLQAEGSAVELVIHAPPPDRGLHSQALSAITAIRVGESLSQDQVLPAMQAADVLVHVESFEPVARKYTRLSLSTKVPQYMSCGKPILAYGPAEVASCRYIHDCQSGVLVGEESASLLLKAVRSLATVPERRAVLGRCGWRSAVEHHSADSVRERFRSALARVAAPGGPIPAADG